MARVRRPARVAADSAERFTPSQSGAMRRQVGRALLVAQLAGVLLGAALAAVSVLMPGLLPPLG